MPHFIGRITWGLVAAVIVAGRALPALAQTDSVTTRPPSIVVPNYNGVPVGPYGGLEGGAYVARAYGPAAAWFNPSGLSRSTGPEIAGSAGIFQLTTVSPKSFADTGGSVQQVPNLVGFTFRSGKVVMGAALLTTVAWNQETDAQLVKTNAAGNQERVAYSSDSDLGRDVLVLSAAYDNGKAWRLGAGLAFSYTSLRMVQSISDRIAEPALLKTLLVSSRESGSAVHLRPVIGVQLDPAPHVRIGGVIRTSGFSVYTTGSATLDGTQDSGAASVGASFFDPSAQFEDHLPVEYAGALALTGARAEIELDVLGYSSVSPYLMISSPASAVTYQDPGNGAAPAVAMQPFAGLTSASRAVANVSVGGHVQLSSNRKLLLHYGAGTDHSPVAPEDQIFDKVNLITWTLGLSGTAGKLTYAAGVNYRGGTTDAVTVRNALDGQPVQTTIGIRTIGMIYSLAYQF